jgi:hypothetical protein
MLYSGSVFFTLMLQLLMSRWEFLRSDEAVSEFVTINATDLHQRFSHAKEGQEENSGSQGTSPSEGQDYKSIILLTITDSFKAIKKGGKKQQETWP